MLADFGAEVIKVQSAKMATGIESNTTPYFCAWNRNKRSITLDMDYSEARKIFLKLVKISDIVVENFSPRVMSNWDLDYATLKKSNERLIMLSMSGTGQNGPWKDFVAYGPTVQSLGGLTYLTSYSQDATWSPDYMVRSQFWQHWNTATDADRDNTSICRNMKPSARRSARL
jgi:crotonobetainyl-CoA:carnitine CoA-transferase CaiB-like acyl-CoA transferase